MLVILRSKYARICPLASRILQKCTRIFKYVVFYLSVFEYYKTVVLRRKYDKIQL